MTTRKLTLPNADEVERREAHQRAIDAHNAAQAALRQAQALTRYLEGEVDRTFLACQSFMAPRDQS